MHCCICKATIVMWIGELMFCLQFVGEYRRFIFDRRSASRIGHATSSADITFPISAWPSVRMHGTNFVQANKHTHACTHTHTHTQRWQIFFQNVLKWSVWDANLICYLFTLHLSNRNCGSLATFASIAQRPTSISTDELLSLQEYQIFAHCSTWDSVLSTDDTLPPHSWLHHTNISVCSFLFQRQFSIKACRLNHSCFNSVSILIQLNSRHSLTLPHLFSRNSEFGYLCFRLCSNT